MHQLTLKLFLIDVGELQGLDELEQLGYCFQEEKLNSVVCIYLTVGSHRR
jgi:hypothetical protein